MSENIIKNEVLNHDTTNPVANYITQVKIGTTVYDIATHHGIKFRDGNNDTNGVTWNGLSDLEIVIPNVADIVQTPVEFIGTVETNETVKSGDTVISTFEKGNLVFITRNCTFGGETCEAGDMAIYDGSNWKVISGENQVNITGKNNAQINADDRTVVTIKGDSTDVLEVEGKALSLNLDYSDIVSHVNVGTTGGTTETVKNGKVTVSPVDLKLKSTTSTGVVTSKSIKTASALKSGAVKFTTATDSTFVTGVTGGTLSGGKMPELLTNNDAKNLALGGSFTVSSSLTDFVTSVGISEKLDKEEVGAFKLHDTLTPTTGTQFVTGINNGDSFTVSYIKPEGGLDAKFIKYVSGSYVTSVNEGAFKLGTEDANGKNVVVGLGTTTSTESGDVVANVEINDSDTTDVFNGASVNENHILEFSTTPVVKSVGSTITYKNLSTQTVAYTPTTVSTASFTEGKFETDSTNTFTLNKSAETTYTLDSNWYKFNLGKGGYGVSGVHAIVPKETFGVSLSESSFPTISTIEVERKGSLAATVGTELDYNDAETLYTLTSNDVIKTYTLGYAAEGETGDVSVGAADTYNVNGANVNLEGYIKGVTLSAK